MILRQIGVIRNGLFSNEILDIYYLIALLLIGATFLQQCSSKHVNLKHMQGSNSIASRIALSHPRHPRRDQIERLALVPR